MPQTTEAPAGMKVLEMNPAPEDNEIMADATQSYREVTAKLVSMAQRHPENQPLQRALSQAQIRLEESHGWLSTAHAVSNNDADSAAEAAMGN